MCQAKSLGGKRCAIHHHGTQAAIQTTSLKTNVDTPLVKEVFSELNKEGKKLPAPSREEYEGYIAKERFMTEIDPAIEARDKKMILKKLDKAVEENTPSGGTFHAWKNLMTATINKYGKKAKLVLAAITLGAVVTLTGGCAQVAPQLNSSGVTQESVVIADATITDEYGSYMKVKLKADDPNLKLVEGNRLDMATLTELGYTEADALAAQQFIANFAATEMVDSPVADNPNAFGSYMDTAKANYITGSYISDMTNAETQLVYRQADGLVFARDGKPRFTSNKMSVGYVSGHIFPATGQKTIEVTGSSEVDYRVPDKNILTWYQARHPEMTVQQITDKLGLKDTKEETLKVKMSWSYWVEKDASGAWKIAGFGNTYEGNIVGMDVTK